MKKITTYFSVLMGTLLLLQGCGSEVESAIEKGKKTEKGYEMYVFWNTIIDNSYLTAFVDKALQLNLYINASDADKVRLEDLYFPNYKIRSKEDGEYSLLSVTQQQQEIYRFSTGGKGLDEADAVWKISHLRGTILIIKHLGNNVFEISTAGQYTPALSLTLTIVSETFSDFLAGKEYTLKGSGALTLYSLNNHYYDYDGRFYPTEDDKKRATLNFTIVEPMSYVKTAFVSGEIVFDAVRAPNDVVSSTVKVGTSNYPYLEITYKGVTEVWVNNR